MGKIDQSVKSYVKIPGIFTQLFNESFFDKEHYIDPEDVSEQDSVTDVPLRKQEIAERIRDVCMLSKSGMGFRIILGWRSRRMFTILCLSGSCSWMLCIMRSSAG